MPKHVARMNSKRSFGVSIFFFTAFKRLCIFRGSEWKTTGYNFIFFLFISLVTSLFNDLLVVDFFLVVAIKILFLVKIPVRI